MTVLASDNEFPSVLLEQQGSAPASPAAGFDRLYTDTSDVLSRVTSAGAVERYREAGSMLAYHADTTGDETTSSASLGDVDATNDAVTFVAPTSGKVLVRLSATVGVGTSNSAYVSWGLREGSTDIAGGAGDSIVARAGQTADSPQAFYGVTKAFVITGLTPGSSHTYKWSHAISAGTATLKAIANSPAVMEVIAL